MSNIAYWSESQQKFAIHKGHLDDVEPDWADGVDQLRYADVIIFFPEAEDDPQRLLVLSEWASQLIQEDLVATVERFGLEDYQIIEGVAGVQEYMRERTGDRAGPWDRVP